jgi:hypothetical protein
MCLVLNSAPHCVTRNSYFEVFKKIYFHQYVITFVWREVENEKFSIQQDSSYLKGSHNKHGERFGTKMSSTFVARFVDQNVTGKHKLKLRDSHSLEVARDCFMKMASTDLFTKGRDV